MEDLAGNSQEGTSQPQKDHLLFSLLDVIHISPAANAASKTYNSLL